MDRTNESEGSSGRDLAAAAAACCGALLLIPRPADAHSPLAAYTSVLSVLVFASLVGVPLKRLVAGRWPGADRPPRWTRLLVLGFAELLVAGAVFAVAFRDGFQALAWGAAGYVIVSFALHRGLLVESVKTHAHALVLALTVPVLIALLAVTAGQTLYALLGG